MGFRFRKSKNFGPFRISVSKSGIGWSVGTKGIRYTKRADGKRQTTLSVPGTGISYVDVHGNNKKKSEPSYPTSNNSYIPNNNNNKPPFYKQKWFMWLMLLFIPPVGIVLMWLYSGYKKVPKVVLSLFFGIVAIAAYTGQSTTHPVTTSNNDTVVTQEQTLSQNNKENDPIDESIISEEPKLTGWQNINNITYYYDNDGNPKAGWIDDNKKYYYCDNNGVMKTGWIQDNNEYYYCSSDGSMQKGWVQDNGNWYYLNDNGTMAKNITKDDYTINSSGIATKEVVQASKNNTQSNSNTTYNNSSQASNSIGNTVYIASSGKGKKYHSNPNCSKMNGTISLTTDEAKSRGYTPCSKCY